MAELVTRAYTHTGRIVATVILVIGVSTVSPGEPVSVRYSEGLVHGFLALRNLDGELLADGDLLQRASGMRVTSRLVFRFKDGSLHDETAVFSQRREFR